MAPPDRIQPRSRATRARHIDGPIKSSKTSAPPVRPLATEKLSLSEASVLQLAASLDQDAEHPLAATVVAQARQQNLHLDKVENFESSSGIGVRGQVTGKHLALGNTALMKVDHIDWQVLAKEAETLRQSGASVMFLAADGKLAGLISVSDAIKPTTLEALAMSLSSMSVVANALRLRAAKD